ncbi:MAG: hypothetical protein WDN27_00065 [Candidatus Saccharibacteria bacterium]
MATSSDAVIQGLMDQTDAIDPADPDLLSKMNEIAQKIAARQRELKAVIAGGPIDDSNLIDPSDEFACEGCQ